ncbi:MAG: hypothetical protein OEX83_04740 [Gammaproteobacteria bacterium]|nr:hypothetical protein [Gammaproteobacteria bacterium]
MDTNKPDILKVRDIRFSALHPDKEQARTAVLLLNGIQGIETVSLIAPTHIQLTYNVLNITLKFIEETLVELGFHLDNSLLYILKRSLYHYTEETQRANLGCRADQGKCTRDIFINRYQQLKHGCRDERPRYWREYL